MIIKLLVNGLVIGCIYGLLALGYSLIYKSSGLMSFVQGDFLTMGAYIGLALSRTDLPFYVFVPLTMVTMFIVGMLVERVIIRPLKRNVKAKLFCPEIAGLFCRIAGLFCHDSRANLSLKPVCFGIAIS